MGERVYTAVNTKKRQCEPGAINVIVLGLPNPVYSAMTLDDGLLDSLDLGVRLSMQGDEAGGPPSSTGPGSPPSPT